MELDLLPLLIALSCYKFYDLLMELVFSTTADGWCCCALDLLPLLIALSCYKFYDLLMELGFLPLLLMAGVVVPFFCY